MVIFASSVVLSIHLGTGGKYSGDQPDTIPADQQKKTRVSGVRCPNSGSELLGEELRNCPSSEVMYGAWFEAVGKWRCGRI